MSVLAAMFVTLFNPYYSVCLSEGFLWGAVCVPEFVQSFFAYLIK